MCTLETLRTPIKKFFFPYLSFLFIFYDFSFLTFSSSIPLFMLSLFLSFSLSLERVNISVLGGNHPQRRVNEPDVLGRSSGPSQGGSDVLPPVGSLVPHDGCGPTSQPVTDTESRSGPRHVSPRSAVFRDLTRDVGCFGPTGTRHRFF